MLKHTEKVCCSKTNNNNNSSSSNNNNNNNNNSISTYKCASLTPKETIVKPVQRQTQNYCKYPKTKQK
jgi:hypothetical protein